MAAIDPRMRVSDDEREDALAQLRRHMLAGRLTADELDERMSEAGTARTVADLDHALRELPRAPVPAPPVPRPAVGSSEGSGAASTAVALGAASLGLLVMTAGVAFVLSLPLGIAAWATGRDARARGVGAVASRARTGEILGMFGTGLSLLAILGILLLFT